MTSRLRISLVSAIALATAGTLTTGVASAATAGDSSTTTLGPVRYDCAGGAIQPRATFVVQQPESAFDTVAAPAGENLAALEGGEIPFTATVRLPAATVQHLRQNGDDTLGGKTTGSVTLGRAKGAFELSIPTTDLAPASDGTQTLTGSGGITSLPLTGSGRQVLKLPNAVSLALISGAKKLSCTRDRSTPAATPLAVKVAPAAVTARANGTKVAVTAKDGAGNPGHGKVTATFRYRAGGKVRTARLAATLANGRATLNLAKKLSGAGVRSAQVTVTFAGAAAKPVTVRR